MITVGGLVENLRSNNKAARMSAIRSLVQIGTDARLAVPYLMNVLDLHRPKIELYVPKTFQQAGLRRE
jgi:hypothetical protein